MPDTDTNMRELLKLAKVGDDNALLTRVSAETDPTEIFDRAVTDFHTMKRKPGHQRILQ